MKHVPGSWSEYPPRSRLNPQIPGARGQGKQASKRSEPRLASLVPPHLVSNFSGRKGIVVGRAGKEAGRTCWRAWRLEEAMGDGGMRWIKSTLRG